MDRRVVDSPQSCRAVNTIDGADPLDLPNDIWYLIMNEVGDLVIRPSLTSFFFCVDHRADDDDGGDISSAKTRRMLCCVYA